MTRKRFIKILMSFRIPRNKAIQIAALANSRGISYKVTLTGIYPELIRLAFRTTFLEAKKLFSA